MTISVWPLDEPPRTPAFAGSCAACRRGVARGPVACGDPRRVGARYCARFVDETSLNLSGMAQALGGVQAAHCGIGPANVMRALDIENEFEGAVLPVARLLGHAL